MWYHYDSLNNFNLREARYLVGRIQDYLRPGATPKISEAVCSQQGNGYDCGAYIMAYAQKIMQILAENSPTNDKIDKCIVDNDLPNKLRNNIRDMILSETSSGKPNQNTEKPRIEKSHDNQKISGNKIGKQDHNIVPSNNLKDPKTCPNLNKDKICYFLTKGKCKFGAKGENHLGKCVKYHPDQCREYNLNGTMDKGCKKGNKCDKWHPTYFCYLSIDSKTCKRVDCYFKHHKNCTVTKSENFLRVEKENRRPPVPHGRQYPSYNKWQQHHQTNQHQYWQSHQHQSEQYHQHHQVGNHFNHQQNPVQPAQIPHHQLKQVIQTVLQEMSNAY